MLDTERRALLLLLGLGLLGHAVRLRAVPPGEAPGAVRLLPEVPSGDPLAHRDSARRQARPLQPGERVNVDQATVQEIERLPRVGPRLARLIVADREQRGPFGGLAGLDRVKGIGPSLLAALEPWVSFSGSAAAPPPMGQVMRVELPGARASRQPAGKRSSRAFSP